jgi:GH25 family lysozyme M1 (1,4-beta-N-acetylmuramidase)
MSHDGVHDMTAGRIDHWFVTHSHRQTLALAEGAYHEMHVSQPAYRPARLFVNSIIIERTFVS